MTRDDSAGPIVEGVLAASATTTVWVLLGTDFFAILTISPTVAS